MLNLLLSQRRDPAGLDNHRDFRETALAEDLGVAERKEIDDGGSVGLLAAHVGVTLLSRDQGPQL